MEDILAQMLNLQENLQKYMKPIGRIPAELTGDDRAEFLRWNVVALEDELHEMLGEVGWKPWATSRHLNGTPALKEMVDAWHFFLNILLVIGAELELTNEDLAQRFYHSYVGKNAINRERQLSNYDGLTSKCLFCKTELSERETLNWPMMPSYLTVEFNGTTRFYCSEACKDEDMIERFKNER
jgi:dimeric dUTPase (all-alpha-NTP-PPase superfamily)